MVINRPPIIVLAIAVLAVAIAIAARSVIQPPSPASPSPAVKPESNKTSRTTSETPKSGIVRPGEYRSAILGLSFTYPPAWVVDESQVDDGFVSVRNEAELDLDRWQSIGSIRLEIQGRNPRQLSPTEWFKTTIAHEVDQPISQIEGRIGSHPSYTVVANEALTTKHVYLFSDTRVVEVEFPAEQPLFQQTYEDILNSIRIL